MSDPTSTGPGGIDIGQLFNKAKQMQEKLQEAQAEAGRVEVEGQAGGGMVKARANGNGQVTRLTIEQTLMDAGDREMLEDLIVAAINDALSRGREAQQAEMAKATSGIPLPVDLSKLF